MTLVATPVRVAAFEDDLQYEIINKSQSIAEEIKFQLLDYVSSSTTEILAKILYREYRGPDKNQQEAVIWCICNRVDAGWGTVEEVATAKNQFAYVENTPVEQWAIDVVTDVLTKWLSGLDEDRVLPKDYLWFHGNSKGTLNLFYNTVEDRGIYWDWSFT